MSFAARAAALAAETACTTSADVTLPPPPTPLFADTRLTRERCAADKVETAWETILIADAAAALTALSAATLAALSVATADCAATLAPETACTTSADVTLPPPPTPLFAETLFTSDVLSLIHISEPTRLL